MMAAGGERENPHDAIFRAVVGVPANAAGVLASALPTAIAEQLDLSSLHPVPASFVDPEMRWRHSDLLFTATLAQSRAYVYVVIEHQSSIDGLMPLRMLEYTTRIWRRHLAKNPGARHLPGVLPLVIHHGARRWSAPTSIEELYSEQVEQTAGPFLPRYQFRLHDLTGVDTETLLSAPLTADARLVLAMLTLAPKHAHLDQVLQIFADDLLDLVARDRADGMFRAIMNYAYHVSETEPRALDSFFSGLGPEAKEAHMATTVEQSRAQGRAEGRAEGAAQALTRLLTARFGPLSAEQDTRIRAASADEIDTWIDRFTSAESIDDILR